MSRTNLLSLGVTLLTFAGFSGLAAAQGDVQAITCGQAATTLVGGDGSTFHVMCPPDCGESTIWGAEVYTDDSSICTAAVHAGTITSAGGSFTITIGPGYPQFSGSTTNGVTSREYGEWGRSFTTAGGGGFPVLDCYTNAQRLEAGSYMCPPGCTEGGTVWGTNPYTDDSAICRAAIHAGASRESGRTIVIEIMPGQESYDSSTVSDVTTRTYGAWSRSYTFR